MTKERFCEIIRELEAAEALQRKVATAIRQYNNLIHSDYPEPYGMIVSHDYTVECLLAEIMEDINGDIDYFCNELDYGKKFNIGDLVDDHLFRILLLEQVQLVFRLALLAVDGVFHVIFDQLRERVVHDRDGADQGIDEGDRFRLGIVPVVIVAVHDGVQAIERILDVADAEITPVIRQGRRNGALQEEGGVGMVLIEHDLGPLHRLQGVAVLHDARDHEGIDGFAGREDIGEARIDISLVVVGDRIGKIDGIGRIGRQGVIFEIDDDALAARLRLQGTLHGRGEVDVLEVLDLDVFVEGKDELLPGTLDAGDTAGR